MKKLLCAALLLALLIPAAGCGRTADTTPSPAETEPAAAASARTPEETPEETPAPTETPQSGEATQEPELSPASACPSVSGKLHVEGTSLADENGTPVQLRGVSTHGIAWFPDYINEDAFLQLKQWGANVVRLAMYTAENGGYCTDGDRDALLALLDDGVQYALQADLYVIVDWHILSDGDPAQYEEQAREFFAEVSARYADCDHVLYEICNEPNGGTAWSTVKAYAQDILSVIRANDPDAVVLVGTPNWCQYLNDAAADPITDYDNVMYTLHFYAATHKQDLRDVYSAAVEAGLPVFVSEYGLCEASGAGTIDTQQADAWTALLDENNTSYVLWSLCNKDESASILRADCTKTSGFTQDDLSPVGQWLTDMLSGERAVQQEDAPEDEAAQTRDSRMGRLTADAVCTQQWEEDGVPVYLYTVTLYNGTDEDIANWTITADLTAEGELTDSWNGAFALSGTALTITPADWNAAVAAGASAGDIGLILKGAQIGAVSCAADSSAED